MNRARRRTYSLSSQYLPDDVCQHVRSEGASGVGSSRRRRSVIPGAPDILAVFLYINAAAAAVVNIAVRTVRRRTAIQVQGPYISPTSLSFCATRAIAGIAPKISPQQRIEQAIEHLQPTQFHFILIYFIVFDLI